MTITTGHLCSGYDGLGLALDEAEPHVALWHAEIDAAASRILEREHPDAPNVGNLVDLLLADLWRLAPFVDLLTAGFPCQPVSAAGRQLAQLDPRWLWPFITGIIWQARPHRVFLENVQNLVSIQKGEVFRGILNDLRAAGYASRWVVMGACAVGAPHHRHRVFVVADYVGGRGPEPVRVAPKTLCGAPRSGGRWLLPTPRTSDTNGVGAHGDGGIDLRTAVALLPTPRATDVGTPGRRSSEGWRPSLDSVHDLLPTPTTSNGHGNAENGRGELLLPGIVVDDERWGKYADAVALWEYITGNPAPEPTELTERGSRRLSPALPEWMMGLAPGYLTAGSTRAEALKLAGNGVVPRQAAAAYRLLTA